MSTDDRSSELAPAAADYVTLAARAALGAVPFAGSLLAELAGVIIPNQRVDRIVRFASALEERLSQMERNSLRTRLMEEGLRQAARATTDDRRAHIASVIANSLTSQDIDFVETKHLLRLLGEINDIEVIWLRFYLNPEISGDDEFRSKHEHILRPVSAHLLSPESEVDKETIQQSYKAHLLQLGLLTQRYQIDPKTQMPMFDKARSELRTSGNQLSRTGRLLLKLLGFERTR